MSPRAACRLERLGFEVYDYVLSKVDWLAAGLPTERAEPAAPRVSLVLDTGFPTCAPEALVRELAKTIGSGDCLVLNDDRVVLGLLRLNRTFDADARAEDVMHPGPTTVRADANLADTLDRMRTRSVTSIVVTTPEGVLLGVVHAVDRA